MQRTIENLEKDIIHVEEGDKVLIEKYVNFKYAKISKILKLKSLKYKFKFTINIYHKN